MSVPETVIWNKLRADWITAQNRKEHEYLGIFVVGGANYGAAQTIDDITTALVYFPTIEELALDQTPLNLGIKALVEVNFCQIYNAFFSRSYLADIFTTSYFIINPFYKKLFSSLQFSVEIPTELLAAKIETTFPKIMQLYIESPQEEKSLLFEKLTKTEEKALVYILETIGEKGNLSISEAIKQSGISRPVFNSLLTKLSQYNAAEIRNQGVKGTYICFSELILSAYKLVDRTTD